MAKKVHIRGTNRMKRITPKDFYLDLPCSVVSIGCASERLHGSFDYDKIKAFSEQASANDNYAPLRSVNEQIRKFFKVKKYTYYPRAERKTLKEWWCGKTVIVCVYGHYIFCEKESYYSFFDNSEDKVVAVWELG